MKPLVALSVAVVCLWIHPVRAQHTDYILGTGGLLTVQQAPPGIYLNNQAGYFFSAASTSLKQLNVDTGLNVFADLTTAGWTTPLTLLGANYGMNVTVPLIVTNGSLDLSTDNPLFGGISSSRTAVGTSSIYVEPINLGWHKPTFDAITSFGFFAPAGSYNPQRVVNTGLGRWSEMFSLGGTGYSDPGCVKTLERSAAVYKLQSIFGRFPPLQARRSEKVRSRCAVFRVFTQPGPGADMVVRARMALPDSSIAARDRSSRRQ